MYDYTLIDPILLKLKKTTVSVLLRNQIYCIEQLFGINKAELLKLNGVGAKKVREIIDMLYNLPFDFNKNDLPENPEHDPLLGVDKRLIEVFEEMRFDYNSKFKFRGIDYFRHSRIVSVVKSDKTTYKAIVRGSRDYNVTLDLSKKDANTCDCPYSTGWGFSSSFKCKHQIAAQLELAYQQRLERFGKGEKDHLSFNKLSHIFGNDLAKLQKAGDSKIKYVLLFHNGAWHMQPLSLLDLFYIVSRDGGHRYSYEYYKRWDSISPTNSADRLIIRYLKDHYQINSGNYGYGIRASHHKNENSFADIFHLLKGEQIRLRYEMGNDVEVNISPAKSSLIGKTESSESGKELGLRFYIGDNARNVPLSDCRIITTDPCWVFYNGTITEVDTGSLPGSMLYELPSDPVQIPADEVSAFFQDLFPSMVDASVEIEINEDLKKELEVKPKPRLYLTESGSHLFVTPKFGYLDIVIDYLNNREDMFAPVLSENSDDALQIGVIKRDFVAETEWIEKLKDSGVVISNTVFIPEFNPLSWVINKLPDLVEEGFEVFGEEKLRKFKRPRKMTSKSFSISSGENWFEVEGELQFEEEKISLSDLRDALQKGSAYVKLSDTKQGHVPDKWLNKLLKLLQISENQTSKTRIPKIAVNAVDELLSDADVLEADDLFHEYASRFHSFEKIESIGPPAGFRGELRPYQTAGLSWLEFLRSYGFGGILADDMGLGKTVQVLSFIQNITEQDGSPPKCLIVAPRSVIENWQAEAEKFVPGLSTYIHHGIDRVKEAGDLPDASLTITTYTTLRIDIEMFKDISYDLIVLDESHNVRNPTGKSYKALKLLKSKNRLCLTGTPIHNSTMDLWSQFHFLNPGLIGSQTHFRTSWAKPVDKDQDKELGEMLNKMVSPFILRRTKQHVAKDLPALTSSVVHCKMDTKQQNVYEKHRKTYYKIINESFDEKGVDQSRFTVLEGLTKLRQICCDPQLVKIRSAGSSKIERFLELAEELINKGHKALVFSQFVQFLKIIERKIKQRGWKYQYLDGKTKNRQERVNTFQKDDSSLFLISLKAGGEGLNLTSADYVFIMDPWWNPAAERQAMDRTHRIGQTEKVFVYRLICPDTVEEKIIRLQERKQNLSKQIVTAEAGIFKQLDKHELLNLFG